MKVTILGLSITSSWGNGHATTFRALTKGLAQEGHEVTFFERDVPWYANNQDMASPPFCRTVLYEDLGELRDLAQEAVSAADLLIIGSYVPEGVAVAEWALPLAGGVTAFYDIDTPVTLAKLERKDYEYLHPRLIPRFDYYFSFTGGAILERLEAKFGAQRARALYCCVDSDIYYPELVDCMWDLGYLGTYSEDRQPTVERLLLEVARSGRGRYVVAGPQYPEPLVWPENVAYMEHLPPEQHRRFYNHQRFTLNVTRQDMIKAGHAPSVRLFEAAACGTPIISDWWRGLDEFFALDSEILVAENTNDVIAYLIEMDEAQRHGIAEAARRRVLEAHTAAHRAAELAEYPVELRASAR